MVGVGGQRHIQAVLRPGKGPSTHLQEAVRAPGPLSMDAENVAPTSFRSPDPPIRSESLYRLHLISLPPGNITVLRL